LHEDEDETGYYEAETEAEAENFWPRGHVRLEDLTSLIFRSCIFSATETFRTYGASRCSFATGNQFAHVRRVTVVVSSQLLR